MLTAAQHSAATDTSPLVEIRAGAGTGKTTTLLARASAEAQLCGRVRLMTFTRAAMRDAARRLEHTPEIGVDTIHGTAAAIIRRHDNPDLRIVDEIDVRRLRGEATIQRRTLDDVMASHGLTSYGDLIPRAVDLLQRPSVLAAERGGSILLDEGQDMSAGQWALVHALQPDRVTVVHDPAQRIYGWRGAIDPPTDGQWSVHELGRNWRSAQPIIEMANALQIPGRVDLTAAVPDGGHAVIVECADADAIEMLRATDGTRAVLTRTRARAMAARTALLQLGEQVHSPGLDAAILDRPEGRLVLDLLRCIADPHDSLSLSRVLLATDCSTGDLARLELLQHREACSLWDAALSVSQFAALPPFAQRAIRSIYSALLCSATARDALESLPVVLADVGAVATIPAGLSPLEAIEWAADPDRGSGDEGADGAVHVGTIHGSKGLEWDSVLVLGCEDGALPLRRAGSDVGEEQRVLYVGITRARRRLLLSWSSSVTQWGRTVTCSRSRFLQVANCG